MTWQGPGHREEEEGKEEDGKEVNRGLKWMKPERRNNMQFCVGLFGAREDFRFYKRYPRSATRNEGRPEKRGVSRVKFIPPFGMYICSAL